MNLAHSYENAFSEFVASARPQRGTQMISHENMDELGETRLPEESF